MQADPATTTITGAATEWTSAVRGSTPIQFTAAGAQISFVAGAPTKGTRWGLECEHCDAKPDRAITTTLDLLAFRARHEHCRPVWARKATAP